MDPDLRFLPPEGGWGLDDFPEITVVPITYTTNTGVRADPFITITAEGQIFIELATVRLALPRESWHKLANMVTKMLYAHQTAQAQGLPQEENDDDRADDAGQQGQPDSPGEPEPGSGSEAPPGVSPE